MSDYGCEITVEDNSGELGTFHFDCEKASYFNENLENTSGSTIYLYKYKQVSSSQFNPTITISNYRYPVYRSSQGLSGVELYSAKGTFNTYAQFWHYKPQLQVGLLFLIMFMCLVVVIRKGK